MSSPFRILLPVWSVLACVSLSGAVSLDDLVKSSPFMPGDQAGGAVLALTENAAVEFRGMISTREGVFYGLYDRTNQTGAWVRKEDAGADFIVHSYDAASDMVAVDYHGQKFNLALSSAKIGAAASSALMPPTMGGGAGQTGTEPAVARVDDQRRLESIAAEVRRRRALRQGAVNGAAGSAVAQPDAQASGRAGRNRQQ